MIGSHAVDMIISKDLFLLGDQDYLRLAVEKRQQRAMGRSIINAPRRDQRPATSASNRETCRAKKEKDTCRKIPRDSFSRAHRTLAREAPRRGTVAPPFSSSPTPTVAAPRTYPRNPARGATRRAIRGRSALRYRSSKTDRLCQARDLVGPLRRAPTSDRERTPLPRTTTAISGGTTRDRPPRSCEPTSGNPA